MATDALLAGFVAGYIVSVVDVAILTMAFARARNASAWINKVLDRDVPMVLVTVPLFTGSVLFWTAVGLVLGVIFHLATASDPDWVAGSSNIGFSVVIAVLALAFAAAVLVVRPSWWREVLLHAAVVLACFGWLLPALGR